MDESRKNQLPIAVFVHLGSNFPEYLRLNLSRHLTLFPEQKIALIVDKELPFVLPKEIHVYQYQVSENDERILELMRRVSDFHFRNGFWKYTFLRLFALGDYHETCPMEPILHIESDVILMPNFPWLDFVRLERLSWLGVSELCDVASLVFSPNSHETNFLLSEIRKYAQIDPTTTDMYSLKIFAKENPTRHSYLPSLTPATTRNDEIFDVEAENQLKKFHGYFDPSALGMWYFGQDPKNKYGVRKRYFIDETYYLDPREAQPFFENGRLFDSLGLNIYSLHIHSKFLPLFGSEWDQALVNELTEVGSASKSQSFSLEAFLGAVKDRKLRQNIWLLVANVPGLNFLRKYSLIEKLKERVKIWLRIKM